MGLCPLFFRYLYMKALDVVDKIKRIIEPLLEENGLEVVDVEYRREPIGMVLRVFIDRPEGVDIEACSDASALIERKLDETDVIQSAFNLEVSSPGLERPLVKPEHYRRFVGSPVRLRTKEPVDRRRKYEGRLARADDDSFVLETDEGEKEFKYSEIAKANLIFSDW